MKCPRSDCGKDDAVRNGKTRNGHQRVICRRCKRTSVICRCFCHRLHTSEDIVKQALTEALSGGDLPHIASKFNITEDTLKRWLTGFLNSSCPHCKNWVPPTLQ